MCDAYETLYANIENCKYYHSDSNIPFAYEKNSLVLLHLNIRSLLKNFDMLNELLASVTFVPELICSSETSLKHCFINLSIPNYLFVHADSSTAAGGVAVYISNELNHKKCQTQHAFVKSESLWLEVTQQN